MTDARRPLGPDIPQSFVGLYTGDQLCARHYAGEYQAQPLPWEFRSRGRKKSLTITQKPQTESVPDQRIESQDH